MKKLLTGAVLASLFLGSCAQNKEKREEFKEERNKDYMRNNMGDTAASHSESATADSVKMKSDSAMKK
ncbi:hypothetical protein [Chryseobacterium sp. POE27]|uniref:hypothetical protein n=1 Tax=Chryseobacterium sp. POE27 TaxID=3138177 RepID=UPI00321AEC06